MSIREYPAVSFCLIAALALAAAGPDARADAAGMDSLVSAEWLRKHLDDPDLVVLDCTVTVRFDEEGNYQIVNGRGNYDEGHIPNAGFADLLGELSEESSPLMFAVPSPERFAAVMGALGVGDDSRVVLYSRGSSSWPARVWWMLRWIGFDNAALLDGGQEAWTSAGYELSTDPGNRPAKSLTVNLRPELIVDRDEVFAAIDDDSVDIIDALSEAQYRGETNNYGRPGHIPGASNVPAMSLVDESGRYKAQNELEKLFTGDRDRRTITYCGGGIAASADAFIMTRLGYKDVAVYTASLQEWAADPANPLETVTDSEEK